MMQLLCNGERLDIYDNMSLQFKHTNPLFAFDKMECERTTQFKLPCTPTNDGVLSLARIPAYSGTGMIRRFSAQLQAGTIVKDGYLYVSDYDGKDYNAIFVTGELVALQSIKNAGNIGDYYAPSSTATFGTLTNTPATTLFQTLRYANLLYDNGGISAYGVDDTTLRPCISLYVLLVQGLQQVFGFSMPTPASDIQDLVYIPEQYVDSSGDEINTQGTTIDLQYNMPEWTGVDLIKTIADVSGYLPSFENNTLSFVYDVSELGSPIDITDKLIQRGKVTRTLSGFARHNTISWKDADTYGEQIEEAYADYEIDNDNIEDTRELATIPAQPALFVNSSSPSQNNVALLWDKYAQDTYIGGDIVPLGAEFIARWNVSSESPDNYYLSPYGTYPDVLKNPIMEAICSASTQIEVTARMRMHEYYIIGATDTILVDGTRYVWLERSWQNDVAKFTLAKIA